LGVVQFWIQEADLARTLGVVTTLTPERATIANPVAPRGDGVAALGGAGFVGARTMMVDTHKHLICRLVTKTAHSSCRVRPGDSQSSDATTPPEAFALRIEALVVEDAKSKSEVAQIPALESEFARLKGGQLGDLRADSEIAMSRAGFALTRSPTCVRSQMQSGECQAQTPR
jgi:hypothetical protein